MSGQFLDKYEILDKVGEGGMATVYKGVHRPLKREVAIKILHSHLSDNTKDRGRKNRTRFEREARAIESLDCPNIPEIYDFSGPEAEQCFIITEFINGPTLAAFVDEVRRIPSEPAALIGIQICTALICAHDSGIIHRDIKPENIMMDSDGCVKLMDFGIARVLDESHVTLTGALVGSPAFMSPEQALDREVDGRSDLFSLGTLLYLMVTGEMPFRGGNPSIVLKGIIEGNYEDPLDLTPDIHPHLARVIDRCLSTIPEERPPSAEAVREELHNALWASGLDPDDPGELWGLSAYFTDPIDYAERLQHHLVPSLIRRGRELIEAREPTEALHLLNRVLTLDDGNAEVIDLIGRMGGEPEKAPSNWWLYGALVLIIGAVGFGLWWQLLRVPVVVAHGGEETAEAATAEPITPTPLDALTGGFGELPEEITPEEITPEEITDTSDRPEEITPEEITDTSDRPEEITDTSDRPEEITEAVDEEGTGEEGDADTSVEPITEAEAPRPLGMDGGRARLKIQTPNAAGTKLYYRYREGGQAHLLQEEAAIAEWHDINSGRIQVWVEGAFHRTRSEVLEIKPGAEHDDIWHLSFKDAVAEFSGLPDGTLLIVGEEIKGEFPGTQRIAIAPREVVRITMRAPDGEERPCVANNVDPAASTSCQW